MSSGHDGSFNGMTYGDKALVSAIAVLIVAIVLWRTGAMIALFNFLK